MKTHWSPKDKYGLTALVSGTQSRQSHRDRKWMIHQVTEIERWLPGAGRRETGNYYVMGTEFSFCKTEAVLWMDGGVAQHERT